jgi:uncharacterized SAM-binding protein YcdF (DUF218 family)
MFKTLFDWLSRADPPANADAIFVLAGRKKRKVFAIRLLEQGAASRILFSVGRFEIRRFPELDLPQTIDLLQMAQAVPPPQRHFFVLLEENRFTVQRIPLRVLGTLSEIDALADWLAEHPAISSLLIVSSGAHLRRLRICCRALLPRTATTSFLSVPEDTATPNRPDWRSEDSPRRTVLLECLKIACYSLFLPFWKWTRPWRSKRISSVALK